MNDISVFAIPLFQKFDSNAMLELKKYDLIKKE